MTDTKPKAYPGLLRATFAALALVFIGLTFTIMSNLSTPSLYINAIEIVKDGPMSAGDISHLNFLNFKNLLYLHGPVNAATVDSETGPLFHTDTTPALSPSTFTDSSGAVEVLAPKLPLTSDPPDGYFYKRPYHFLGWRTGTAGFSLFAVSDSKEKLLFLLKDKSKGWKSSLFINGFIMAVLVFAIFWMLNMSMLSTPFLEAVQLLIVNIVFLVLFYSVLFLSGYPILSTLAQTAGILVLANIIFIPLSLFIRKRNR